VRQSMRYPLLVDGRNLYDPQEMVAKGFFYQPVGRPVAEQTPAEAPAPMHEPAEQVVAPSRAA
jgi:hypothetical protein